MMEEWIFQLAKTVAAIIDLAMVLIIAIGSFHTLWRVGDRVLRREALASAVRDIWLHFAAWILLALEFALAADLIETVIAPSWEEIGQLGAIAVIRIALGYFLGRDIAEIREPAAEAAGEKP
jgi:uncharacterized membrane protein